MTQDQGLFRCPNCGTQVGPEALVCAVCGHAPGQTAAHRNMSAISLAIGGVTAAAGGLLPWAPVAVFGGAGSGGDGLFAFALGAVMLAAALAGPRHNGLGRTARGVAALAGGAVVAITGVDAYDAISASTGAPWSSIGAGLPISAFGGIIAIATAIAGGPIYRH